MTGAVFHVSDQSFWLAEFTKDGLHDVDVRALIVPADIIYFTHLAAADHKIDRPAVIFDVKPVANIESCRQER